MLRAVRAHTDLGLVEARRLVKTAPCVLAHALVGDRGPAFVAALEAAGARARGVAI